MRSRHTGLRTWATISVLAVAVCAAGLLPTIGATPPTPGNPVSVPGGSILSVPVDPFMTASEEQRILDLLSRPMSVDWTETSPEQIAADLDPHVRTMVDTRALEDLGLTADVPLGIPTSSNTLPLGSNLITVLEPADLTFQIRGNRLIITTVDDADDPSNSVVRIYDVTPLVTQQNTDGMREVQDVRLIDSIMTVVDPDTWEVLGGPSTIVTNIVRDRALMTVSTTTRTHLAIQAYLDRMNAGRATLDQDHLYRPQQPQMGAYPYGGMM